MRILMITPRFPYPPLKGEQAIAFHRLKLLSRKHEITLVSFYESDSELTNLDQLLIYCENIHLVKKPKWISLMNVAFGSLVSKTPLQLLYYTSNAMKRRLLELIVSGDFDIVHAYLIRLAPVLESINLPIVLELVDSMQLNLERRLSLATGLRKLGVREELRRIRTVEPMIGEKAEHLTVVSDIDRQYLATPNVTVVPLGVDTSLFTPSSKKYKNPTIVFSGNMGYGPNIDAVEWFVEKCFGFIVEQIPDVTLLIVGGNVSKEVKGLGVHPNIRVTGYVESMAATLASSHVAIAPMQSGSGMQFKILEAMASGLPVVTTTLGLGALKADKDCDLLVEDSPELFASLVIKCLKEPSYGENIGANARTYVKSHHSWQSAVLGIERIYRGLLEQRLAKDIEAN